MKKRTIAIGALLCAGLMMTATARAQSEDLERAFSDLLSIAEQSTLVTEKAHLSPAGTVVEFFNQNLKHYFRTADPAEATAIMNGAAGPGWVRTNDDFPTWTSSRPFPGTALGVCRFYAPGPNSHFYTADAGECAFVKLDPGWHYEGIAFYAAAKTSAGTCGNEYAPIYRAYNNRFAFNDSNHRFTTSTAIYQQMIAQGWIGEGVVMCVPLPTTVAQQKTEQLLGGAWVILAFPGGPLYTDRIPFTDLTDNSNDLSNPYALAFTQRSASLYNNTLTLGQFAPTLNQWLILAPYLSTAVYPADVFLVTLNGNTFTGCYYFAISSSSLGACKAVTGMRQ